MPTEQELMECAIQAARAGGNYVMQRYARRGETIATMQHDVKLALDVESQRVVESTIQAQYPTHDFLGEEQEHDGESARAPDAYQWIVDPIDGTVNFTHGSPHWACSVAVRRGEELIAGAVYAPVREQCYWAARGAGAKLNGAPISVSKTESLAQAMVRTGLDQKINTGQQPYAIFMRIADGVQKARVVGSAALDMCRVGEGAADGYYESGIFLWDVAAASVIVEEAGGRTEVLSHPPAPHALNFLASNGRIHDDLRDLITGG